MKDPSKSRSIRLLDYLIEQGVGSDPKAQAAIFSKILSDELEAVLTIHPALPPVGASTITMFRYANSEPREVAATSHGRTKAELRKAVLCRDPDWSVLGAVTVMVPAVPVEPDRIVTKPAAKRLSPKHEERALIILKAIEDAGLDRYALAKKKKGEREGDRAKVWRKIPSDIMNYRAFENTWVAMLKTDRIRYKDQHSLPDGLIDTN